MLLSAGVVICSLVEVMLVVVVKVLLVVVVGGAVGVGVVVADDVFVIGSGDVMEVRRKAVLGWDGNRMGRVCFTFSFTKHHDTISSHYYDSGVLIRKFSIQGISIHRHANSNNKTAPDCISISVSVSVSIYFKRWLLIEYVI